LTLPRASVLLFLPLLTRKVCVVSRMNRLGPPLMHRLDQLLEFIDFNSSIELDYLQIVQCLEGMRQRCCQLNHELQGAREQLRQSEFERSVLEVKLKHARNQVEVEMKKRHLAEAELEKQERKLQLIYDYLMADPQSSPLNEQQQLALSVFSRPGFSRSSLLPGKRLSAMEELGTSVISDISFDHSDDEVEQNAGLGHEVELYNAGLPLSELLSASLLFDLLNPAQNADLDMIKPTRGRGRSSLAPLIQPVVAAKRARPSLATTPS
ncbi:Rac GTPase-activating protein 1, partial [Varanus komodoensis]